MKKFTIFIAALSFTSILSAQNLVGKILFSHFNKASQTDTIYSMSNNGANITFITEGYRPRLSHDGNHMAFSNGPLPNQSFNSNIWMRDLIAQHDTLIVGNSGDYVDYYDFSPSDAKVVYGQGCNLYTSNIDGTNSYTYVGCVPCDCWSDDPTVRLSDSLIVYHNYHYGIYTSGFDGSNPAQVPHTYPGDLYPIWSPDGQWFSYLKSDPGLLFLNNLFKNKADGSDSVQLTFLSLTDSITADPVWASDMQSIYVIARINGTLGFYRVSADGSGAHTLLKEWNGGGSVYDFWLGLADSISSNPISVQSISSPESELFITPNPATSNAIFQISLEKSNNLTLEIFDMIGRKVETIFSGNLSAGNHSFNVNLHSFQPETYFVRMKTSETSLQRKLMVLH